MLDGQQITSCYLWAIPDDQCLTVQPMTSAPHLAFSLLLLPWGEKEGSQSRGTHSEGGSTACTQTRQGLLCSSFAGHSLWTHSPGLSLPFRCHPRKELVSLQTCRLPVEQLPPSCPLPFLRSPPLTGHTRAWAAALRTPGHTLRAQLALCTAVPPTTHTPLHWNISGKEES